MTYLDLGYFNLIDAILNRQTIMCIDSGQSTLYPMVKDEKGIKIRPKYLYNQDFDLSLTLLTFKASKRDFVINTLLPALENKLYIKNRGYGTFVKELWPKVIETLLK